MKKLLAIALIAATFTACNDGEKTEETTIGTDATTQVTTTVPDTTVTTTVTDTSVNTTTTTNTMDAADTTKKN